MKENTLYVGNLDDKVTEALLWELMLQAGPVTNVHIPRDRVTSTHQGFGFVEFTNEENAEYALKIMNLIKLYGKPIRVNKAVPADKRAAGLSTGGQIDVGANLFVGSLDPDVDEKLLFDTFGQFGTIINAPKVARDQQTGQSKGYAFVSFDDFDSSDAAIAHMNGQYLCNRPITVSYAFKRDSKSERHGTPEERLLAAEAKKRHVALPLAVGAIPPNPPPSIISPSPLHTGFPPSIPAPGFGVPGQYPSGGMSAAPKFPPSFFGNMNYPFTTP